MITKIAKKLAKPKVKETGAKKTGAKKTGLKKRKHPVTSYVPELGCHGNGCHGRSSYTGGDSCHRNRRYGHC